MARLRNTVQAHFRNILDSSSFTSEDFDLIFGDSISDEWLIEIKFLHEGDFYLKVKDQHTYFYVEHCPSEMYGKGTVSLKNYEQIYAKVSEWTVELREELEAQLPLYRDINNLKIIIEESINSTVSEDEEFSVEEINELKRKFEELESRVSELESDEIITSKQKQEFSKGIKIVSDGLEKLPKQTWLKTSVNKLTKTVSTIAKSKEGRALLADGARKFLGLD